MTPCGAFFQHSFGISSQPFALLLHGLQEKNTASAEALKLIKRNKKLVEV